MAQDENESESTASDQAAKGNHELENKVAVPFCAVFAPGLGDRAAIAHDAVGKHEASARVQPKQQSDESEHDDEADDNDRDDPGLDVVQGERSAVMMCLPIPISVSIPAPVVEAATTKEGREPGG